MTAGSRPKRTAEPARAIATFCRTAPPSPIPPSRAQHGDVHGASIVVDPPSYHWRHPDWRGRPWHETVLYEASRRPARRLRRRRPRTAAPCRARRHRRRVDADRGISGRPQLGLRRRFAVRAREQLRQPDDLRALIDAAHGHGLMMFLDVVYNHFGPDGNYLARYAPEMFRDDVATPWGPAIDFRRREVRRFFTENALYWLLEYRFDGLRFDAVHAIADADWLDEMAAEVRKSCRAGATCSSRARKRRQRCRAPRPRFRCAVE